MWIWMGTAHCGFPTCGQKMPSAQSTPSAPFRAGPEGLDPWLIPDASTRLGRPKANFTWEKPG